MTKIFGKMSNFSNVASNLFKNYHNEKLEMSNTTISSLLFYLNVTLS